MNVGITSFHPPSLWDPRPSTTICLKSPILVCFPFCLRDIPQSSERRCDLPATSGLFPCTKNCTRVKEQTADKMLPFHPHPCSWVPWKCSSPSNRFLKILSCLCVRLDRTIGHSIKLVSESPCGFSAHFSYSL